MKYSEEETGKVKQGLETYRHFPQQHYRPRPNTHIQFDETPPQYTHWIVTDLGSSSSLAVQWRTQVTSSWEVPAEMREAWLRFLEVYYL
jgi:hypothetical protein